jgi:SpoVK/Ycf46/Vps4 family AAA+-type ATPase/ribosomal protein S18
LNQNWYVLSKNQHRCIIYLSNNDKVIEKDVIYITPLIANLLQINNGYVFLSDIYSHIPINKLKFRHSNNSSILQNLPEVKKIVIKRFKKYSEDIDNIAKNKIISNKIVSINQIFSITDNFHIDSLYGVFKNNFHYYKIYEIEYKDYDCLRSFIIDAKSTVLMKLKASDSTEGILNSFVISDSAVIKFIQNDFEEHFILPSNNITSTHSITNYIDTNMIDYFNQLSNEFENYINDKQNLGLFLIGPAHCGRSYIIKRLADKYAMFYIKKDMNDFLTLEDFITYLKKSEFYSPAIIHFDNADRINQIINDNNQSRIDEIKNIIYFRRRFKLFFIFSFDSITQVNNNIRSLSELDMTYSLPDLKAREEIQKAIIYNILSNINEVFNSEVREAIYFVFSDKMNEYINIDHSELSKLTVGFSVKELKQLIIISFEDFIQVNLKLYKKHKQFIYLDNSFMKDKVNKLKGIKVKVDKSISSIPEVRWEDVGGLENAKEDIYDTIQLPLKYPKLFDNNLKRRSGLLLYGPPGSGKTLLAKAIANECSMNFISIKGPELLNMYVGESEKNIREVFEKGRSNKPCVLFFDEIDALAPARNKNSDQNNVMDRIVAQFMTEMDGINKDNNLIIIASTNRPDLVDTALLRPGRFDKMIYIGLPKSLEERVKIFKAQTRKLSLDNDVDFMALAEKCPENFSGADIYSVCTTAFTIALKETLDNNLVVRQDHFWKALEKVKPSLSETEIEKYEQLKLKYTL